MAASLGETFVRVVPVESSNAEIRVHQCYIGDVGCVVWDAALVLCKYIDFINADNNETCPDVSAGLVADASSKIKHLHSTTGLELGGGTGVVGLFAASLGCQTWITDLEDLMPLLQKNIKENCLADKATGLVLKWGEHNDFKVVEPDLVFIADCVYYSEAVLPLLDTLSAVTGPNTIVLISYEDRDSESKQALQRQFSENLRKDFDVEEVPAQEMHPDYRAEDIHILVARKKRP